jgi:hypothetical protein
MEGYDEFTIFKMICIFYFALMISLCMLYLWTMYSQYKNAHDKWYDIEYDLSPRSERIKKDK